MRTASPDVLPLADHTLSRLRSRISVPAYDRATLTPAVVHLGLGGFHRSHQAVHLDDLAARGSRGWGIVGVSLRSPAATDALTAQDCLYTVVTRDHDVSTARVVGAIGRCLHAPREPEAVLDALTRSRTRVVSLTVTAGGYHLDPGTGECDVTDPGIAADLADPRHPTTTLGFLAEALDRRRRAGIPAFTVLSCDNVPDNGATTRAAVVSFAARRDPGLAAWIDAEAAFPGSVVDRITPGTSVADREAVAREFGVADRWPIVTEAFSQWVIEDSFCHGRPPLEEVGARFVGDVAPYKLVKARLLNGGHCALGYLGTLAGHRSTDEAMRDPLLHAYLDRLLADEVGPLLPAVAGLDPVDHRRTLLRRLGNPGVRDPLARLCARGSVKMPAYLLPSLAEARAQGRSTTLLTLAVAAWFQYLRVADHVEDARAACLRHLAGTRGHDPRPLLGVRSVFGTLGEDTALVAALASAWCSLDLVGPHATVRERLTPDLVDAA